MKRAEAELISHLESQATVADDGIPILAAVPGRRRPELLRVWCRYCKCWHLHGMGYGHRVAHCVDWDRRGRDIISPYRDTGYYLAAAVECGRVAADLAGTGRLHARQKRKADQGPRTKRAHFGGKKWISGP